jgi:hypothetical protein
MNSILHHQHKKAALLFSKAAHFLFGYHTTYKSN